MRNHEGIYNNALQGRKKRIGYILPILVLIMLIGSFYGSGVVLEAKASSIYAACEGDCNFLPDYYYEMPEKHTKAWWTIFCNQQLETKLRCK